jgi:hypothetical protein
MREVNDLLISLELAVAVGGGSRQPTLTGNCY